MVSLNTSGQYETDWIKRMSLTTTIITRVYATISTYYSPSVPGIDVALVYLAVILNWKLKTTTTCWLMIVALYYQQQLYTRKYLLVLRRRMQCISGPRTIFIYQNVWLYIQQHQLFYQLASVGLPPQYYTSTVEVIQWVIRNNQLDIQLLFIT